LGEARGEAARVGAPNYKRSKELNPIRMRPTPHEFYLYFDT
jgi:hypothetical protein